MSEIAELQETVELKIDGKSYEFPVIVGTEDEKAIDISSLRGKTGYITLDLGYKNTGSCKSAITFLDGERGILHYRGYSIESLADNASFLGVAYLLLFGELPTQAQLSEFEANINKYSVAPESVSALINAFPKGSHPMGVLAAVVCSLSGNFPESQDPYRPEAEQLETIYQLMALLPTISAMIYRRSVGKPFVAPDPSMDYSTNFLNMMYGGEGYKVNPDVATAINKLLILHADHEQNCSASTVRIVGSSHANLFASISAGITALWGPLHGGANQEVIEMLENIKADGGDHDKWLGKAKDKNDPFRLMGFGHRVYKNFDPRARIIKKAADDVLSQLGIVDPVLDIAKKLEEAALSDPYFVDRKLYPNVDFYSGIIYRALGIPTDMFTVMFALGRLPGWISQWKELRDGGDPIGRPRQVYTGYTDRPYVSIENR
jgi:citrate synthase